MDVTGSAQIKINLAITKSLDLSSVADALNVARKLTVASTVGDNHQVNAVWHDQRTLTTGQTETLDLSASLSDSFGDLVTFFDIKMLYIRNLSTANNLEIGGIGVADVPLCDNVSDIIVLPPESEIIWLFHNENGLVVDTNDQLKMTHSGTTAADLLYNIAIAGLSAAPTPTPTPTPSPTPTPTPT